MRRAAKLVIELTSMIYSDDINDSGLITNSIPNAPIADPDSPNIFSFYL